MKCKTCGQPLTPVPGTVGMDPQTQVQFQVHVCPNNHQWKVPRVKTKEFVCGYCNHKNVIEEPIKGPPPGPSAAPQEVEGWHELGIKPIDYTQGA